MTNKETQVVVVGGGFGGVKTALELSNQPGFEITLLSNNTHFEYHGALYRSAVGRSPLEVVIPLKDIFKKSKNVELILDSAGFIDAKKKRIASLTGEIYSYDKAVLALGNTVNYFGIDGLEAHTETMHDITSTIKLRNRLMKEIKSHSGKPLRIIVVGAGASGVELAGELPTFTSLVANHANVKTPKLSVVLIDATDRVLPMLSKEASRLTLKHLNSLGIEVHLNTQVKSCEPNKLCLQSGELKGDVIVWTAGSKPVDFYANNADVFTIGRGGRVVADEFLQPIHHKDIFVLGDNVDTPYSGMAQTALHDAKFVAANLLRMHEHSKPKPYAPRKPVYVVTAGPKWAIVEQGNSLTSGRIGWSIRRKADLAIFRNFEPYKQAIKTWQNGNRYSKSI